MKSLFSFAVLAFLLLTTNHAFTEGILGKKLIIAVAKMEKKLMQEGWVKLSVEELKALTDFTASDDVGWAEYIDPSGTKVVTQSMSGIISKGTREVTADGLYCHQYKSNSVCWFLWKRGKVYLNIEIIKPEFSQAFPAKGVEFTIKPGNTENL